MTAQSSRPALKSSSPPPTTADLRRDNLGRVLRLVHEDGAMTRAAITERLGLARGTVGVLLDMLVRGGLLVERSPELPGTRGRPSPVFDTVPTGATVLAVDLAVEGFRLAVVGLGGRVLSRHEWPWDPAASTEQSVATLVQRLRAAARRRTAVPYQAVGVACWGIVRGSDGFVHLAPNLGWRDVALGALLAEGLGAGPGGLVQHVVVANDADLGAVAEYRRGAGEGARRLLYVHSDVGVGGGIVHEGTVLGASGGYAGEIGHMTVDPRGVRCRCGAVGCWETEVDERALLRAAGVADPADPAAVARAVAAVLEDARAGRPAAAEAVRKVATALGAGLANLVHILGPDRIVLGGYLADLHALSPVPTRRVLQERGFSAEARDVPILPASRRADASFLGAAEYALEPLLSDPAAAQRPR
ncbi:sugar kinase [Phytohabitans suffuscus]|uniref:Sugar kinase n=1 Tax=Phytohabitans suffuscus TaxID=624315 RepID=A0A6F8Z193_9ACTN|nr:ROK family transcriptional regulator [Phytohabitans suffuscus]BCB91948.1 sugar kinase [Phytohabitans suffuscus]